MPRSVIKRDPPCDCDKPGIQFCHRHMCVKINIRPTQRNAFLKGAALGALGVFLLSTGNPLGYLVIGKLAWTALKPEPRR